MTTKRPVFDSKRRIFGSKVLLQAIEAKRRGSPKKSQVLGKAMWFDELSGSLHRRHEMAMSARQAEGKEVADKYCEINACVLKTWRFLQEKKKKKTLIKMEAGGIRQTNICLCERLGRGGENPKKDLICTVAHMSARNAVYCDANFCCTVSLHVQKCYSCKCHQQEYDVRPTWSKRKTFKMKSLCMYWAFLILVMRRVSFDLTVRPLFMCEHLFI